MEERHGPRKLPGSTYLLPVTLAAAWVPVCRTSRVDPVEALRAE